MELVLTKGGGDRLEDCRAVFLDSEIYARYFADDGRLERSLKNAADKGELYLALTATGEIAGAMRVAMSGFCGLYPYLALIGTRSDFRGKGVGRFLLDALERMAREGGYRRVTLMVSDFNLGAKALYEARGYRVLGEIPDAAKPGIGEFVMIKDL
ncbi:MAG: GNAT family N-acetyltransferase [Pseudoflavonifractor sp.]